MNVRVNAASRDNHIFASYHLGPRANNEFRVNPIHCIGIASFTHLHNTPILDPNITLDNPPMIDNQGVGDDEIECAWCLFSGSAAALAHPITNNFAAAKGNLITIGSEIFLHLDNQFRISQAHAVPCGGAVEVSIGASWNVQAHSDYPPVSCIF